MNYWHGKMFQPGVPMYNKSPLFLSVDNPYLRMTLRCTYLIWTQCIKTIGVMLWILRWWNHWQVKNWWHTYFETTHELWNNEKINVKFNHTWVNFVVFFMQPLFQTQNLQIHWVNSYFIVRLSMYIIYQVSLKGEPTPDQYPASALFTTQQWRLSLHS